MNAESAVGPVTLEPVSIERHGPLLTDWLHRPHVTRWWGESSKRLAEVEAMAPDSHAIIAVGDTPVGYLRWQEVDRGELEEAGLAEIPDGSIDIDIFIGESNWIGRGVGSSALRLLIDRIAHATDAPLAGLCTSVDNTIAIAAYEKVGFRKLRTFDDPGFGLCWVLTMDIQR